MVKGKIVTVGGEERRERERIARGIRKCPNQSEKIVDSTWLSV